VLISSKPRSSPQDIEDIFDEVEASMSFLPPEEPSTGLTADAAEFVPGFYGQMDTPMADMPYAEPGMGYDAYDGCGAPFGGGYVDMYGNSYDQYGYEVWGTSMASANWGYPMGDLPYGGDDGPYMGDATDSYAGNGYSHGGKGKGRKGKASKGGTSGCGGGGRWDEQGRLIENEDTGQEPIASLLDSELPDPGLGRASLARRLLHGGKDKGKGKKGKDGKGKRTSTLRVSGLETWMDESYISEALLQFGTVVFAKLLSAINVALVDFSNSTEADACFEATRGGLVTESGCSLVITRVTGGVGGPTAADVFSVESSVAPEALSKMRQNTAKSKGSQPEKTSKKPKGRELDGFMWAYIDPRDNVQTGFPSSKMRGWYESGYFEGHLEVALMKDDEVPDRSDFFPMIKWFPDLSQSFLMPPQVPSESM